MPSIRFRKDGRSHLPENSILYINRPFAARFSNCSNSLNFEAKINFNTTRQNDLKWRKTCIGLKFDLEHFYGLQTKCIRDSLYKHPVLPHPHNIELGRYYDLMILDMNPDGF